MARHYPSHIPGSTTNNFYEDVDSGPQYSYANQNPISGIGYNYRSEHNYVGGPLERHPQTRNYPRHQHETSFSGPTAPTEQHAYHRPNEILIHPMELQQQQPVANQRHRDSKSKQHRPAKATGRQRPPKNRITPSAPRSPQQQQQQRAKRSEVGICTKYFLFVVNFFVFIIGIGLTSLGAYILHVKEKKVRDVLDFLLDPSCDMALVGAIFLLMGFIGLVGALRENTFFLKMHYALMVVFLLVQLAACILVFVAYYSPDARDAVFPTDSFKDAIRKYRDDIDMQNLIDGMQKGLGCCGLSEDEDGFLDWNDNPYFHCDDKNASPERCSVPSSCCKQRDGQSINHQCGWKVFQVDKRGELRPNEKADLSVLNQLGCLKALADWIDKHALVVGGVLLGILLPQIFQVVLTSSLIRMISLQKLRWRR